MRIFSIAVFSAILAAAAPVESKTQATPATSHSTQANSAHSAKALPANAAPQALSEEEQQALQQRDETPASHVAGGALSNQTLTYIVIALAAAVLVLVLK
jgi:hypothetical protein